MYKVKIFTVHKSKEKWLNDAIFEYEKRLSNEIKFSWNIFKDEKILEKNILEKKFYICLDEKGSLLSSLDFNKQIFHFFEKFKSELIFVIGSDAGLSKKVKENAFFTLSLSRLTFTHQMIRIILLEQIYRAFQIQKNTNYHK
ncbi:MAG: 23S rRNA (pseudouridine(1915)-N(3))-methyltransferase RlmH [Parachlamydiales bacterium]|nr:23S rRNA (pseudouridine(1915)-N(3))-methyltransferase RlmH [Parachlamydiales bacterium]